MNQTKSKMPRTRKPQVARPAGRVASTTTWATKNVPSPVVYRIPTGRRDYACEGKIVGSWVAPIHVRWIDEHEFQVYINDTELRGVIENYNELDLSNTKVTLNQVDGPIRLTGNLDIENWILTVEQANIDYVNSQTVTTDILTATTGTITNLTSEGVSTGTLDTTGNVTIDWTLWVTGETSLSNNLNVTGNVSATGTGEFGSNLTVGGNAAITGNETVGWNLDVTGDISGANITASASVTTVDLTATGATSLQDVTADDITSTSITNSGNATIGGTLWVTWATTLGDNLSVAGNETVGGTLDVTGASTFTGAMTAGNITSTGTSNLNDLNVAGNETVAGTLGVTGNTTLNSALTVAGATTLSSNATVGGNLSVSGNSTVTGTSTTTGNAIFNNDVTVSGNGTIAGNTTIWGTLWVTWDATLADDLYVNGSTHLKDVETDGSVDIDGTLRVTGAITATNWARISGQVESDSLVTTNTSTENLYVSWLISLGNDAEAPDFVLQSEKGQPNGVCPLDANGKVDPQYLPPVYTTAIVKMGTGVFSNSNTAVVVDADITADSAVICTNYSDIVWDLNEVINIGQLTVVSNQVETGSFKYLIINPIS